MSIEFFNEYIYGMVHPYWAGCPVDPSGRRSTINLRLHIYNFLCFTFTRFVDLTVAMQVTAKHKEVYFSLSCEEPKIEIAAKVFEGYCHSQRKW